MTCTQFWRCYSNTHWHLLGPEMRCIHAYMYTSRHPYGTALAKRMERNKNTGRTTIACYYCVSYLVAIKFGWTKGETQFSFVVFFLYSFELTFSLQKHSIKIKPGANKRNTVSFLIRKIEHRFCVSVDFVYWILIFVLI